MVISNKPLQFIIAILIACLPVFGFANSPTETTPAHTEKTAVGHETSGESLDEKSEIKEKVVSDEIRDEKPTKNDSDNKNNSFLEAPAPSE